jgi:predicted esterase
LLVGLSGNVDEHGMAQFFKRNEAGVFDLENFKEEVDKLVQFIIMWNTENIFFGYSNGANFILATLLWYPHPIKRPLYYIL